MPRYKANQTGKYSPNATPVLFELSAVHLACVRDLVGHALATIERELILQTLRCHQGNRTRAASVLKISVRSLRDRIRIYREAGEDVPPPASPSLDDPSQPLTWSSH